MKYLFITIISLLSFSGFAEAQPLRIGDKIPNIVTTDIWGQPFDFSAYNKERFILIDFWASWCGPCVKDAPQLAKNYKKFKEYSYNNAEKGFDIVSISLDFEKKKLTKAINKYNFEWEKHLCDYKMYDSEWAQKFDIPGVPFYLLVAPDQTLIGVFYSSSDAFKMLEKFVKK